jgi:hypothetical protein
LGRHLPGRKVREGFDAMALVIVKARISGIGTFTLKATSNEHTVNEVSI